MLRFHATIREAPETSAGAGVRCRWSDAGRSLVFGTGT
jgi:hypothetical protein